MQLRENTLLQGGKFRIIRCLGKGGFGITYLAEDTMLGVNVALKEFFIGQYCNRDANTGLVTVGVDSMRNIINGYYEKFLKEAGKIRMLNHSNIVRVYEVFRENGTAYYAMDYHSNGSLSGLVKKQGALSESDALYYIRQVASALKYIHSRNMVHLDVKPDNILLDSEGNAILIDFGISKHYDKEGKATTITPGAYTPGYAANSQMSGSKINTFSPTLDIYSLGATLYNLITGEEPPSITEILDYGFSSMPAAISSSTRNAIEKSMAPKSAERPKSVDEFLALLCPQKKKEKITLHCDPLFFEAARLVVEQKEARRSTLQRYLAIGLNRAGNILEELSQAGIVSAVKNSGEPCELLCKGKEELEEILSNVSPVYKEIKPQGGNIPHVENVGGNRPRKPFNWKPLAVIVATLLCIVFAGIGVDECNDYRAEQQRLDAIEKARQDSIAAADKKRNAFETKIFNVNGIEFTMVPVDGGTFNMGSNDSEAYNKPVHSVTLSDYYIGETEVTQELWLAVMGSNPSRFAFKGDKNPVEQLSYHDCIYFINNLNTLLSDQLPDGRKFRLPTEAQWEFAARGGNKSKGYKYSGSNNIDEVANYKGNCDHISVRSTAPVKRRQPNELGLYDMSGNVWEWCSDWYADYSSSPQINPEGPSNGEKRVHRGGCWGSYEQACGVAYRRIYTVDRRGPSYGLRLAID